MTIKFFELKKKTWKGTSLYSFNSHGRVSVLFIDNNDDVFEGRQVGWWKSLIQNLWTLSLAMIALFPSWFVVEQ